MTVQVHGRKGNDMYEMKYLTEDDMPYFRRLAKEGRAVIIELSDQALFDLDMDSFRLPSGEIDRKKLEEVLLKEDSLFRKKAEDGKKILNENRQMEQVLSGERSPSTNTASLEKGDTALAGVPSDAGVGLMEKLSSMNLSEEKLDVIIEAIRKGATDEEIKLCLNPNISADRMKMLADALIKRRLHR